MRILNDDSKKESAPIVVDPFLWIFHTFLTAFALSTGVLAPIGILFAQVNLPELPFRIVTLASAVMSLLWLGTPVAVVLLGFIFGSVISEGVVKGTPFWKNFGISMAVFVVLGVALFFWVAPDRSGSLGHIWTAFIQQATLTLQASIDPKVGIDWDAFGRFLLREGPFLYLSLGIFSFWISIGIAAHFGVLEGNEKYSSIQLRRITLPNWVRLSFVAVFLATLVNDELNMRLSGVFRILSSLMLIQGSAILSQVMESWSLQKVLRTVVYFVCFSIGIPLLILSVFGPEKVRKLLGKKPFRLPFESEERS